MKLSIISPVYKAENIVNELVEQIDFAVRELLIEYEIILVEDGSPDACWEEMMKICKKSPHVRGFKLSRNFGQHAAIMAGLSEAKGEWIVVMDCDLQDDPAEIPVLLNFAIGENFDIVLAKRIKRNDSFFKVLSSKVFYKAFSYLTDTPQDPTVANFGVYHKKVIKAVLGMKDKTKAFPLMVRWTGFKVAKKEVRHNRRLCGKSSYNLSRLFKLSANIILSFSEKPLFLVIRLGMFLSFCSGIYGLYVIWQYFSGEITVLGYSSIVVSIWFLSGLIIFVLGVVGSYVGKIFEGIKDRPDFIVDQKLN